MKQLLTAISVVIVAGATFVSGIIQGRMSERWGTPVDTVAIGKKLEQIPAQIGDWRIESRGHVDEHVRRVLESAGDIYHVYVNQKTGEAVKVVVVLGPSGPISVHTPEICYCSRAHTIIDKRKRVRVPVAGGPEEEFWALTFQKNDLNKEISRAYYAWSTGGKWSATEQPRFTFARYPYLYKLQLASQLPPNADLQERDPCLEFLKDFVPAAKLYLVDCAGD
jgi:hypothetical protein